MTAEYKRDGDFGFEEQEPAPPTFTKFVTPAEARDAGWQNVPDDGALVDLPAGADPFEEPAGTLAIMPEGWTIADLRASIGNDDYDPAIKQSGNSAAGTQISAAFQNGTQAPKRTQAQFMNQVRQMAAATASSMLVEETE